LIGAVFCLIVHFIGFIDGGAFAITHLAHFGLIYQHDYLGTSFGACFSLDHIDVFRQFAIFPLQAKKWHPTWCNTESC
jgi:hypothetical protein